MSRKELCDLHIDAHFPAPECDDNGVRKPRARKVTEKAKLLEESKAETRRKSDTRRRATTTAAYDQQPAHRLPQPQRRQSSPSAPISAKERQTRRRATTPSAHARQHVSEHRPAPRRDSKGAAKGAPDTRPRLAPEPTDVHEVVQCQPIKKIRISGELEYESGVERRTWGSLAYLLRAVNAAAAELDDGAGDGQDAMSIVGDLSDPNVVLPSEKGEATTSVRQPGTGPSQNGSEAVAGKQELAFDDTSSRATSEEGDVEHENKARVQGDEEMRFVARQW